MGGRSDSVAIARVWRPLQLLGGQTWWVICSWVFSDAVRSFLSIIRAVVSEIIRSMTGFRVDLLQVSVVKRWRTTRVCKPISSSDRDSLGLFVEDPGIAKFADSKRSRLYKLHGRIIVFPSPAWEIFCIYPLFTHFTTMPSPRLIKAAQTVTILSILEIVVSSLASSVWLFKSCMGMVPWRIVYLFLSRPITRSTWIRTDYIFLEASTSLPPSCRFPLVKAGMMSWDPVMVAKSSCRVNPQSARIWSEW